MMMLRIDVNLDVIMNPDKGDVQIFQNLEVVADGETAAFGDFVDDTGCQSGGVGPVDTDDDTGDDDGPDG